jgi:hypothetical protein
MKRIGIAVALTVASAGMFFAAGSASAASCDSGHGAPGGFGPDSPYYTISAPHGGIGGQAFGARQGEGTGDNNSGYSAYCNG